MPSEARLLAASAAEAVTIDFTGAALDQIQTRSGRKGAAILWAQDGEKRWTVTGGKKLTIAPQLLEAFKPRVPIAPQPLDANAVAAAKATLQAEIAQMPSDFDPAGFEVRVDGGVVRAWASSAQVWLAFPVEELETVDAAAAGLKIRVDGSWTNRVRIGPVATKKQLLARSRALGIKGTWTIYRVPGSPCAWAVLEREAAAPQLAERAQRLRGGHGRLF